MIKLVVIIAFFMGGEEVATQDMGYKKPFANVAECENAFALMKDDLLAYVRSQYREDLEIVVKSHTCGAPGEDV